MQPVSPVIKGYEETVYAKDQPEYIPLPSIREDDGCVITRWQMTRRERLQALVRGSVYLEVLTFNRPLQPLRMGTTPPLRDYTSKRERLKSLFKSLIRVHQINRSEPQSFAILRSVRHRT